MRGIAWITKKQTIFTQGERLTQLFTFRKATSNSPFYPGAGRKQLSESWGPVIFSGKVALQVSLAVWGRQPQ